MTVDFKTLYQKDTLEVSDIKAILGCGRNQAYNLVNSGSFHVVRLGKKIFIPRESFYTWYNGNGEHK